VLPASYYSTYYVVELDFWQFFQRLGIPTSLNSIVKVLASKFEISENNSAQQKLMIQGKPGILVHDISSPIYTYTIEAPIIVEQIGGNPGFLRYNCLNYLALKLSNWQWQKLHHYPSDVDYNTSLISNYVALKKYSIQSNQDQIMQTLIIESSIPLNRLTNSEFWINSYYFPFSDLPAQSEYILGRLCKNYDTLVGFTIEEPNVNSYQFNSGNSGIFLNSTNFEINFEYSPEKLINVGNFITFNFKNYQISNKFSVIGFEQYTIPAYFNPSEFSHYETLINLSLSNLVLVRMQLPMICNSKAFDLNPENLITTNIAFSFNGATYYPSLNNLFYSDLFN